MPGIREAEGTRDIAFGQAMARLAQAAAHRPSVADLSALVLDELRTVLPYEWAIICRTGTDDAGQPSHDTVERGMALHGVTPLLVHTSRPLIIVAGEDDHHPLVPFLRAHELQRLAQVPFAPERAPGFLAVASRGDAIEHDDLPYLEAFANLLSLMFAEMDARDTVRRLTGDVEQLLRIGREISRSARSDDIIMVATCAIAEGMGTAIAMYALTDDGVDLRAVHAPSGHNQQHVEFKAARLLQMEDSPIDQAMALVGNAPDDAMIVIDVTRDEAYAALRDLNCLGIAVVPLELNGKAIGAMAALTSRTDEPARPHRSAITVLLPRIAVYLAPAIHSAEVQQELRALYRENGAVRRISEVAWQSENVDESVNLVARTVSLLFDADMVTLYEMRGDVATWHHTYGSLLPEERSQLLALPNAWLQDKVQTLEDVIVRELGVDPPIPAASFPILEEEGLISFMALPFQIVDDIRGNLVIGYRSRHPITAADVRFARSLTHGVASTLMIRRLHQEARLPASDGTTAGHPPKGY